MDRNQEKALPSRSAARHGDVADVYPSSAKTYSDLASSIPGTRGLGYDNPSGASELSPIDRQRSFLRSRAAKEQLRGLTPLDIDPR